MCPWQWGWVGIDCMVLLGHQLLTSGTCSASNGVLLNSLIYYMYSSICTYKLTMAPCIYRAMLQPWEQFVPTFVLRFHSPCIICCDLAASIQEALAFLLAVATEPWGSPVTGLSNHINYFKLHQFCIAAARCWNNLSPRLFYTHTHVWLPEG